MNELLKNFLQEWRAGDWNNMYRNNDNIIGGSQNLKKIYIGKGIENYKELVKIARTIPNLTLVSSWDDADYIFKVRFDGLENLVIKKSDDTIYKNQKNRVINCFPHHERLTEKANLLYYINKFCTKYSLDENNIIPNTWLYSKGDNITALVKEITNTLSHDLIIVKPTDQFGGIGISVIKLADLQDLIKKSSAKKLIIQEYLFNIRTIKNLDHGYQSKFDLRVNIGIDMIGGLYIHNQISARVSDAKYTKSLDNQLAHITNLDLRSTQTKNSSRFLSEIIKSGELPEHIEWNIRQFLMEYIVPLIYDTVYRKYRDYNLPIKYKHRFDMENNDQYKYRNTSCFQRFGIDLIILDDDTPRLLEINTNPGNTRNNEDLLDFTFLLADLKIVNEEKFKQYTRLTDLSGDVICKNTNPLKIYINPNLGSAPSLFLLYYKYHKINKNIIISNNYEDADIIWKFTFGKLENYEPNKKYIVDKYPNNFVRKLTTKNGLWLTINNDFGEKQKIMMKTYIINSPDTLHSALKKIEGSEYDEGSNSDKGSEESNEGSESNDLNDESDLQKLWIIKPSCDYGGNGIVVCSAKDIMKYPAFTKKEITQTFIIQEYIQNPILVSGLYKVDFRVNYILTSDHVYMYIPILMRVLSKQYTINSLDKQTHVTNLHGRVEDNHSVRELSHEPEFANLFDDIVAFSKKYIVPLFRKNVITPYNQLKSKIECYQNIGADLLITDNKQIKLLELNGNPGNAGNDILSKIKFEFAINECKMSELMKYFMIIS